MNFKIILLLICCLILPHTSNGQKKNKKITVTGTVRDARGAPLKGISIYVDNFKTTAASNQEGVYKIKVKPTVKLISVFSLEHGGQVVEYEGQTSINFILTGELLPADGNVENKGKEIDIGYQEAEKGNLTTSVGEVNMNNASKANYTNIYDMIRGEVPGVIVNGTRISIRGSSSVNASNEPLFVVDGSPVTTISSINPNDVESISILKGSSTAIYGARGANGVILINLKSGKDKN